MLCDVCNQPMPIEVLHSAAGYYIGQECEIDGPYARLSQEYYKSHKVAQDALDNRTFTMREHP